MTIVGLISDTHGLLRPAVLKVFRPCSLILHAGDVGGPQVLGKLEELCPVVAVKGNVDRGDWAQTLPATELVQVEDVWIYILHDVGALDLDPRAADIHMVLSGHSHRPSIQLKNGITHFNPGSAGPKRFKLPVTVAILTVQGRAFEAEWIDLETV